MRRAGLCFKIRKVNKQTNLNIFQPYVCKKAVPISILYLDKYKGFVYVHSEILRLHNGSAMSFPEWHS